MNPDDLPGKSFLDELYLRTKGDSAAQVSMYDVGATLGLSKAESGSLAESLMVEGLVELKTLAGGIGITSEGLAILGITAAAPVAAGQTPCFGSGPLATDSDLRMIGQIVHAMPLAPRQHPEKHPGLVIQVDRIIADPRPV